MPIAQLNTRLLTDAIGMQGRSLAVAMIISITLAACGGSEGDDLDQFIRDSGKGLQGKVEPLPDVVPYVPAMFNADSALHDPFKPRKAQVKSGGSQPNLNRPREALEAFPLESLQLVGVISRGKLKIALIKTPENSVQQVRVGNYLGQNLGMIVNIADTMPAEVKIKEIVQDELSGEWIERPASIVQQDQG
jgi:type IV pilus assembly protein PilP